MNGGKKKNQSISLFLALEYNIINRYWSIVFVYIWEKIFIEKHYLVSTSNNSCVYTYRPNKIKLYKGKRKRIKEVARKKNIYQESDQ